MKKSKHTCNLIRFLYKLIQKFFIVRKKSNGITYPIYWEQEDEYRLGKVYFFIEKDGKVKKVMDGFTREELDRKFAAFKKKVEK